MPENEDALHLWLAVQTQWRAGGMGVVGLDYSEVRHWAREMGIILTPGLWAKIKRLEFFELGRQGGHADGTDSGREELGQHA